MSDLNKHCPDCGRRKATNADNCRFGYCSKWYATRDPEANQDCVEQGIYTQHLKQRIAELESNNSVIVPIDFIKAVAHIGVDFGYGEYKLEQKWIDLARKICTEAQRQ